MLVAWEQNQRLEAMKILDISPRTCARNAFMTVLCTGLPFSSVIAAQSSPWTATVSDLITDSEAFGGCMAKVSPAPSAQAGVSCGTDWVSFSCDGTFNSKSQGATKFSAAQLAYVTGGNVKLVVQDQNKHNGHCFARRIDNAAP